MDGNHRFKSDFDLLHNMCATRMRRADGGIDRISALPDELIAVLLCFLPLRDAVRSSILSSRWLGLWKHKPNLNFKYSTLSNESTWKQRMNPWHVEGCKYVHLVDSVLQSHKAISLKVFSIDFFMNKSGHTKLANWLEFVFLKGVERLALYLECSGPQHMVVLEELLRLCRPQTIILFKSLKQLCLKWLKVSGEDIKLFLRNCPLLEELIIGEVTLSSDVEVCGASLKLKHLEVYGFNHTKSIKVCAPNLAWLKLDEASKKVLLENVPKLERADFRFRCISPESVQKFASAVFCFSFQLKILNLTIRNHKMFFADAVPEMPNLEKLVVEYYGVKFQSLLPVTALVWASPRLEEFKLLYVKGSDQSSREVITKVERSPHRFLKVFKLGGFLAVGDHIELVTYISDNCVALEKIVIGCSPLSMFTNIVRDLTNAGKEIRDTVDYAKRELQGKLPQHIQLQLL